MKKIFLKMLSLTVALLMIAIVFVSCQEDDIISADDSSVDNSGEQTSPNEEKITLNAFEFYEKINDAMGAVQSYKLDSTINMSISIPDYDIKVKADGTMCSIESGIGTDDYYSLNEQTFVTTMTMGTDVSKTTSTSMEGFQNGRMFVMNDSDESSSYKAQKLYSDISVADYVAYDKSHDDGDMDFDIDTDTCKNATCSYDDKSKEWVGIYKGFTDDAKEEFDFGFSDLSYMMGDDYVFSDIEIRMVTDDSFIVKSIKFNYIFDYVGDAAENKANAPHVSMSMTCSGVNSTPKGKIVDLSGYTKVDDLRILDAVDEALEDRAEEKSGWFTFSSELTNSEGTAEESYTYRYSHKTDGSLVYTLVYKSDDGNFNISYSQGKATITYPNYGTQVIDSTDDVELQGIRAYIDYCDFSTSDVTNIEVVDEENGVYRFVIGNVDMDIAESVVEDPNGSRCSQYFTFTLKDGALMKYECTVNAVSNSGATGSLSTICEFVS